MKTILLFLTLTVSLIGSNFKGLDYYVNRAIEDHIFPGVAIIVGNDHEVLYKNAWGHFTYDPDSPETTTECLFDMASVTKVVATTSVIMKLVDEGKIDIYEKVSKYIPEFAANGKEDVLVLNLLLHDSGLPAYYSPKKDETKKEIFDKIFSFKKFYETGSKTLYSCLNFVTLMKVSEAVTGKPMYEYYKENITGPLGMKNTMFTPPEELKDKIVPTMPEIHGFVHDPLACALGGLSGNAGLFSTVDDLAVFSMMMLNKGEYKGKRIISEATIEKFTALYDSTTTRGIGWATNVHHAASAGVMFSETAYGHTGFTGTSIWIDPVKKIFTVILSNRVYPDETASVGALRLNVHNTVVMAIEGMPPVPEIQIVDKNEDGKIFVNWKVNEFLGSVDKTQLFLVRDNVEKLAGEFENDVTSFLFEDSEELLKDQVSVYLKNIYNGRPSPPSHLYTYKESDKKVLIINGCDKVSAEEYYVEKAVPQFADALPENYGYVTVNDDIVRNGEFDISGYNNIIWTVGEDNSAEDIFDSRAQEIVKKIIEDGKKILVSGSEIAWCLGRWRNKESDKKFFAAVMRSDFVKDKSSQNIIEGVKGSGFEGVSSGFGVEKAIYHVEFPDVISPKGSDAILTYGGDETAGIKYEAESGGKMVFLAFPFETIVKPAARKLLMKNIFDFFEEK